MSSANAESARDARDILQVLLNAPQLTQYYHFDVRPDRVPLRGIPLATGIPKELGATDTILLRLDDAVFDKKGVAVTRLQVKALQLASVAPIKTSCGEYRLRVTLNGPQPVTRMQILQDSPDGGRFVAPLSLRIKVAFTPVIGRSARPLELYRSIHLSSGQLPWSSHADGKAASRRGAVSVDTDGDSIPDLLLPGTSANFAPGQPAGQKTYKHCVTICHVEGDDVHCTQVPPSSGYHCEGEEEVEGDPP